MLLGLYEGAVGMGIAALCALLNFVTMPANINNLVKKALGVCWILLAPYAAYAFISAGLAKMNAPTATTAINTQWTILIGIFLPIMVALAIHGYYSVMGEYDAAEE
ncbi:MAG: hypothetical protein RIS64_4435 [Bacteroidota bacterium]|jgi:hypothetical protein